MVTAIDARMKLHRHKTPQQRPRSEVAQIAALHCRTVWRRPIAAHSTAAFAAVRDRVERSGQTLIIDSCCGTGDSTRHLAAAFPDSLVLGLDKSAHRLARHRGAEESNYLLLRTDVRDFWRLAHDAGWQPWRHYLLYPNPYPKPSQIRKRWYGSPALPALLNLGGVLTVRTNWSFYAEEFVVALDAVGVEAKWREIATERPITGFETKYLARGDALFELVGDLNVGVGGAK